MMKHTVRFFASLALVGMLASSGIAQANGLVQPVSAPSTERIYTPIPTAPKSLADRYLRKDAQVLGNICRNGMFWCGPIGVGVIGAPCCCPTFCGWVSSF